MSETDTNNIQETTSGQPVIVHVNTPPQSQAFPAIVSFFLPGIGQLIQGRAMAWLGWWLTFGAAMIANVILCFTFIGVPLAILFGVMLNVANVCDTAWYSPTGENAHNKKVMTFAWCVVGLAYLCLILFGIGLIVASSPETVSMMTILICQ